MVNEITISPSAKLRIMVKPIFGTEIEIILSGMVSTDNFIELHRRLCDALACYPEKIHVNLEEVTYLSAAGVWLMLEAQVRARSQGVDLTINKCSPEARHVFEILGLSDALFAPGASSSQRRSHAVR